MIDYGLHSRTVKVFHRRMEIKEFEKPTWLNSFIQAAAIAWGEYE
jgi:hypothetical protein